MKDPDVYLKLAKSIAHQMDQDRQAYKRMSRAEMGTLLRQVSGQPRSKIGKGVGDDIEAALEREGFRVFPHINEVGPNEAMRIFRRGTLADDILNAFLHPGATADMQLAHLITKVKQQDELLKWTKSRQPS
jgi:hypothetical protein